MVAGVLQYPVIRRGTLFHCRRANNQSASDSFTVISRWNYLTKHIMLLSWASRTLPRRLRDSSCYKFSALQMYILLTYLRYRSTRYSVASTAQCRRCGVHPGGGVSVGRIAVRRLLRPPTSRRSRLRRLRRCDEHRRVVRDHRRRQHAAVRSGDGRDGPDHPRDGEIRVVGAMRGATGRKRIVPFAWTVRHASGTRWWPPKRSGLSAAPSALDNRAEYCDQTADTIASAVILSDFS